MRRISGGKWAGVAALATAVSLGVPAATGAVGFGPVLVRPAVPVTGTDLLGSDGALLPLVEVQGGPVRGGAGSPSTGGGGDNEAPDSSTATGTSSDGALDESRRAGTTTEAAPAGLLISAAQPASRQATDLIVARLRGTEEICGKLPGAYRIDCIAVEFRDLADKLPRSGDYAEAQAVLDQVAGQLSQIARSSRDRGQPRVSVRVQRPGSRTVERTDAIQAVRPDREAQAAAAAAQAIDRAQVTLLRSVPANDPRQVHYQRIAAAFDGSAVLLRS